MGVGLLCLRVTGTIEGRDWNQVTFDIRLNDAISEEWISF